MTHSAMLMIQPVAERFHGRGALCVIRTVSCRTSAHLLDPNCLASTGANQWAGRSTVCSRVYVRRHAGREGCLL